MQNYESSAKNILILVEFARAMEKELGEISQDAFVEYSLRVGEYTSKQIIYLDILLLKKKNLDSLQCPHPKTTLYEQFASVNAGNLSTS